MAKFKTIITTAGAAKIAAVLASTASIVLDNTAKMAVGDGNGTLPTPSPAQTKLVKEVHRAPINRASIDASDPKNIVAELVIPPETGGFWIREMALYDAAGTLLAVGNMAETYKPSLSEGAGRKMVIRMVIAVSEVSAITITMDTTTVMATQDYVDSEIDKHAKSRNHPDATLTAKGFTQLNSATNSALETQAATPKAVKTVMDATNLKAPISSPALTGKPTAPTAAQTVSDTQIATTAYVKAAVAALINSSPDVLDTLGELAAALGNDANFATTMTNQLALKAPLASPGLTGLPTAPTAAAGTSTKQLSTTEFVQSAIAVLNAAVTSALALKAPLASPALTGAPTAPTAAQTVNNTQIATTAFVKAAVTALVNSSPAALDTLKELADALGNDANFATTMTNQLALKASLASPALTGAPTAPTAAAGNNTTQLATTEFVSRAVAPALLMRGDLPANANLNNYGPTPDFIGKWGKYSSAGATIANGFPEDGAVGDVEILPYNQFGGGQRYTVRGGRMYLRNLTGVWNGVDGPWSDWFEIGGLSSNKVLPGTVTSLSDAAWFAQNTTYILSGTRGDGPVGLTAGQSNAVILSLRRSGGTIMGLYQLMFTPAGTYERRGEPNAAAKWTAVTWYPGGDANGWRLVGADAMAAIGQGISSQNYTTLDWQQFDFVSGQNILVNVSQWVNVPAGLPYVAGDIVTVECIIARNSADRYVVNVTSQSTGNGNRKDYRVVIYGAKGSRAFGVDQLFTSDTSTVIPLVNGGTGGKTAAEARTNLELKTAALRDVGIGANQIPDMSFFTGVKADTGYQKLPSGIIIQWGLAAATIGVLSQKAYPVAFPNAALHVFLTHNVPNDVAGVGLSGARTQGSTTLFDYQIQALKVNGTDVTATASGSAAISMHFLAIGY